MPRAKKNQTPAPAEATGTPAAQPVVWVTKSHVDSDFRIPAPLREQMKVLPHESFTIEVLEQSNLGFTFRFVRQTS